MNCNKKTRNKILIIDKKICFYIIKSNLRHIKGDLIALQFTTNFLGFCRQPGSSARGVTIKGADLDNRPGRDEYSGADLRTILFVVRHFF